MIRSIRRLPPLAAVVLLAAAGQAQTPAAAPPAAPKPLVVLLGTAGGPPPHLNRSQPASMVQVGGRTYLIDAGENVGQQLTRAGSASRAVAVTFLTHMHWDHMLGLPYLMATGWMQGRTAPMPIYGPPGLAAYAAFEGKAIGVGEDIFRPQTPGRPPLASLYPIREVDVSAPKEIYRDDQVRVTAVASTHFAVVHGDAHSYGADKSYAYRFDTPRGSVVFTGDTGPSEAVTRLAKGADILVTEICDVDSITAAMKAMDPKASLDELGLHMRQQHLSPEEVGKMATQAGVGKLVLSHYVMGQRFDPHEFVAKIRPFFAGEIVVGEDLLQVDPRPR